MTQNLQRHKRDALDVRWKDFGVKEIERLGLIGGGWCCNVWSTHHFQKVPRRYRLPQCDGPRHPMRARAESQWFYRWRQAHDLSVRSGHVYIYTRTLISAFVFVVFFSLSLSSFSVSCVVSYMNRTWCRRRRICVVRCRQCRIACCASSLPSITATLSWERGRTRNKASWGLADLQRFVQHLTEEITAGPKEKGSPVQKEISE